jgi:hypothetical protein
MEITAGLRKHKSRTVLMQAMNAYGGVEVIRSGKGPVALSPRKDIRTPIE